MITVDPVNDSPLAGADGYNVTEDGALSPPIANGLLLNDSDVEGDPMTVSATPITNPTSGLLILNPDGTFTYTPNADFNGMDGFSYEVSDGNGGLGQATVTITVDPVNDAPVGTDDAVLSLDGSSLLVNQNALVANDVDVDGDPLTMTAFTQPVNGLLVDNGNGTLTYTPAANFTGADSFTYTVSDPSGAQATALVIVNVTSGGGTFGDDFDPEPVIEPVDDPTPDTDPVDEPAPEPDEGDPVSEAADEPAPDGIPESPQAVAMSLPIGSGGGPVDFFDALELLDGPDDDNTKRAAGESFHDKFEALGRMLEFEGFGLRNVNLDHELLWEAMDTIKREMSGLDDPDSAEAALVVQITMGTSLLVTAGYVSYILRGGVLAAALVSSLPMWKGFDPLPLLAARRRKRRDEEEEEEARRKQREQTKGRNAMEDSQRVDETTQNVDKYFKEEAGRKGERGVSRIFRHEKIFMDKAADAAGETMVIDTSLKTKK
jgi:hypothetical protein